MSGSLRPYPTALPQEALTLLMDAWSGKTVDRNKAIHTAEDVLAFGLGKVFPDDGTPSPVMATFAPTGRANGGGMLTLTEEEKAGVQEAFDSASDMIRLEAQGVMVSQGNGEVWKLLAKVALQYLLTVFA